MTDYYIKLKKEYLNILSLCGEDISKIYVNYIPETESYSLGEKQKLSDSEARDFQFTCNIKFFDVIPAKEKLFYIRCKQAGINDEINYVNVYRENKFWEFGSKEQNDFYQTKFTEPEAREFLKDKVGLTMVPVEEDDD